MTHLPTLGRMLMAAALAAAQAPHLPPAAYSSYFKPTGRRRLNTPEMEAWNQQVEKRKAEKRARRAK